MPFASEDNSVRLRNDKVEIEIDRTTGRWLSLTDRRDGRELMRRGDLMSPVLLTVNGRTQSSRGYQQMFSLVDSETIGLQWSVEGIGETASEDSESLTVRLREGDWRVDAVYTLSMARARLERRMRISYDGEGESLLRSFLLRQPYAVLGEPGDCCFEAPGYPLRPSRRVAFLPYAPFGLLAQGAFCDAPAWRPPLVGIHHPEERRAIGFWAHTETEPFFPAAERTDDGVMFAHRVFLADRFTAGHTLEWGTQYLELYHTDWLSALEQFQKFYAEVGMEAPADVPEWAKSINLYEVHVGTLTGTTLAPFPTYEPLLEALPSIRDKGFDAVYLMPHVPYPSYSVIDYKNMEVQQGSEEGFRAFVRRSHEIGLRVFIDVTMHGVMDRRARRMLAELDGHSPASYPMEPTMPEQHPYLREHPEWFTRNERGEIAMTYTYAFDHASPSWQDFMSEVFRYYVQDYDVDGFRVDSHTWNFFPNWARELDRPASSSFYGSAKLFKRIRRELKAIKPDVVLYTETSGPLFHTTHELGYNYDETWILLSTLPILTRRGMLCHSANGAQVTMERMTGRDIAWWLAQRQRVMQPGSIKVHHLDCHDTYWGPMEFRRNTFGIPAARAIIGFLAFIEGGFMDYHLADEGSEEFYRRVMRLRQTHPVLRHGSCDYTAVSPSDPMVLAPLRELNGKLLAPVINFDAAASQVTLPIPLERMEPGTAFAVRDLMTGDRIHGPSGGVWIRSELPSLTVALDPYGVRLLGLSPAGS